MRTCASFGSSRQIDTSPIIERRVEPGAILDVGCGEGYLLQAAARRGWRDRHGVDIAEVVVRLAARFAAADRGTLPDVSLPSSTFDVVTFLDSFEHVSTPVLELHQAGRVLKPGGWVYLVTPNVGTWAVRLIGRRWYQFKPNEHVCLYSRRTLRTALTLAGFTDVTFVPTRKYLTLAFIATILGSTNPTLARALETGYIAVMARTRPASPALWSRGSDVACGCTRGEMQARGNGYYRHSDRWLRRHVLAPLSVRARRQMFATFEAVLQPTPGDRMLDVGVTRDQDRRPAWMHILSRCRRPGRYRRTTPWAGYP